jgi:hypothetical protein
MDEPIKRRRRGSNFSLILNLLTLLVLLATLGIGGALGALLFEPYLPYNPFPPPPLPPTLGFPTATNTPEIYLPPTWTGTPTHTATPTAMPTETPGPTETPVPTSQGTDGVPGDAAFVLQSGSPLSLPNIVNDRGCDWMGVGGQVFDLNRAPISGLGVRITGELGGLPISLDTLTGSADELGPAGYAFDLADRPIASSGTLFIQLNDTAGVPLSDRIALTTFDTCDANFIMVNWNQAP